VSSLNPFSVVEDVEFVKLLKPLNEDVDVPCRTTIQRRIDGMYEKKLIHMKAALQKVPGKFSLTTDAWSSRVYKGYMVITAHWVDSNWCLKGCLLDFFRFPTPHCSR